MYFRFGDATATLMQSYDASYGNASHCHRLARITELPVIQLVIAHLDRAENSDSLNCLPRHDFMYFRMCDSAKPDLN